MCPRIYGAGTEDRDDTERLRDINCNLGHGCGLLSSSSNISRPNCLPFMQPFRSTFECHRCGCAARPSLIVPSEEQLFEVLFRTTIFQLFSFFSLPTSCVLLSPTGTNISPDSGLRIRSVTAVSVYCTVVCDVSREGPLNQPSLYRYSIELFTVTLLQSRLTMTVAVSRVARGRGAQMPEKWNHNVASNAVLLIQWLVANLCCDKKLISCPG